MTNPISWGILGAAGFARKTMAPAIHAARNSHVVALATRKSERAAPFSELMPGLRVLESYEELLAAPEIEAVYIPLPNALHTEWSLRAAEAGKHVLCEKPIGLSTEDLEQLIAKRRDAGVLIAEAWMPAHHPQWHTAHELIADGAIGTLHTVTGHFSFGLTDASNIRLSADLGGGALRDIGVYPIGTFRLATGQDPDPVATDLVVENGVATSAWIACRADDIRFHFHVSMRTTRSQEMRFFGTKGTLNVPAPFNPGPMGEAQLHLARDGADVQVIRFPMVDQYVAQVEAVFDCIRNGTDYPCPLEFSMGTQRTLDAIFAHASDA